MLKCSARKETGNLEDPDDPEGQINIDLSFDDKAKSKKTASLMLDRTQASQVSCILS